MEEYETIDDIVLACINKTRPITGAELWERYQAKCRKLRVVPLWGQLSKACTRILRSGKARLDGQKRIVLA